MTSGSLAGAYALHFLDRHYSIVTCTITRPARMHNDIALERHHELLSAKPQQS